MADSENHVSMLPQPRRPGSILSALSEMSASDHNSRSMMQPPAVAGHKRQGSNLPEPAPKRKTLVERAGEPVKTYPPAPRSNAPSILPPSSFNPYRITSASSLASLRSNSTASRQTSNSSVSSSQSTGIRPPSQPISSLARPKTALAKDRKIAESRPKTSHEQHESTEEAAKLKRMALFSYPLSNAKAVPSYPKPKQQPRKAASFATLSKFGVMALPASRRDLSIASQMQALSLELDTSSSPRNRAESPSRLPKMVTPVRSLPPTPTPQRSRCKSPSKYLTRWSNIEALDAEEQYSNFKRMFEDYQVLYKQTLGQVHEAKNANNVYTTAIEKLEQERMSKTEIIISLTSENETLKYRLKALEDNAVFQSERSEQGLQNLREQHKIELEAQKQTSKNDIEQLKMDHRNEIRELKQQQESLIEDERSQRIQALNQASTQGAIEKQKQAIEMEMKDREIQLMKDETERIKEGLEREKKVSDDLRKTLADAGNQATSMETTRQALQAKIEFLESDSKSQSEAYADMERRMNEAFKEASQSQEKLRKEETLRRKLHNQIQELKGNIRVFCRVRPTLPSEEPEDLAQMTFPDEEDQKEIEVKGQEEKNSLGKVTTKTHPYSFDRVFNPTSNNNEIFEEISQLIQSALDGYNVCIFAYGQTGSGKTYTMSSDDGMIPRALRQIYATSKDLEERGWKYTMEGSFVEVYNEEIRDLLGNSKEGDIKKHEIRHDMQKCETTITDVITISLDGQEQVESILDKAMSKRSVAATKANEHSSRSHSVFILKLNGYNSITGERSKGTLNLVDLAGSERLSHSKVEGQRLKETQSINKSLSCLGDVIGALGQQGVSPSAFDPKASVTGSSSASAAPPGAHIPYRNSKLTYLLQFSLGGNSKTLMFVMVAPEKKCLSETLTSLKFADKVSRTRVGVAKRVK